MNKQTTQVLVLSACIVVMVVVAIIQLGPKTPVTPPSTPTARQEPAKKKVDKAPDGLAWIKEERIATMVEDVSKGRNPFQDLMVAPPPPALPASQALPVNPAPPVTSALPGLSPLPGLKSTAKPGQEMALPPVTLLKPFTTKITLEEWTSPTEVQKRLKGSDLAVTVSTLPGPPVKVRLEGVKPDFDRAVAIVTEMNRRPPPPPFKLVGIVNTRDARYAVIQLDGVVYNLFEGESIPKLGWTVTSITYAGVALSKGKLSVLLRI